MRLNGGEFLLDFTALSLTDSASSVTISNKEILSALSELKIYINNQKSIKPVWVKFIDDDSDEIIVTRGEIRKAIGDLEFDLFISSKGHSLSIHVEFTQMVDADSNPLDDYYIASGDASYVYTSAQPIFENIVDEDGHYRYEVYDIDMGEVSGYTWSYCKAVLNGYSLRIVISAYIASGTTNSVIKKEVVLPQWIKDKLIPVIDVYIENKGNTPIYNTANVANTVGQMANNLSKESDKIIFNFAIANATSNDGFVRTEYNLIID